MSAEQAWGTVKARLALGWGLGQPVPRTAALFLAAHPWMPVGHLGELAGIHLADRFCEACADWHDDNEGHSSVADPEVLELAKQQITLLGETGLVTLS